MLEPGYLFDQRYQLKEIIGEGGMSQVWRALDTLLQVDYAIKIYLSHLNDPLARDTIREEFKILKDLHHPNIIRHEHFGVDRDKNLPYIVTTLYEKGSAASIINKTDAAQDEMVIARFLRDAAMALEYLGTQEPAIVHQDIKPDNFLIDSDYRYVLSDFGISIRKRETRIMSLDRDASGNWAGDQAYLAPERFTGAVPRQSQDIFSLGVTLFEIASGVLPFGEIGGIALSSGAGTPKLDTGFGYSRQLEAIIQTCLSHDPNLRLTPSQLIEKSEFYINNQFWPVEKEEKEPFGFLFIRQLKEYGNSLRALGERFVTGIYSVWKPVLASIALLLVISFVGQHFGDIKTYLISKLSPTEIPPTTPVVPNPAVDTATIPIAQVQDGVNLAGETQTPSPQVTQETASNGKNSPASSITGISINPRNAQPGPSSVVEQPVPEKIIPPAEEIITRTVDAKPTVIVQNEPTSISEPVVNIEKPVIKNTRENTPPVITFSQTRYAVLNTQNELVISGFATDDGSIASYEWSQGDNPSKVEFKDMKRGNTLITNVNRLKAGKYTLKLTVTDNEGLKETREIELIVRMSRN